jgi:hypothetical protein
MEPHVAIATHLTLDRDATNIEALQVMTERLPQEDVIAAALKHDEPRLLRLASLICIARPHMLRPWQPDRLSWLHLLATTLDASPRLWEQLGVERTILRNALLAQLLGGQTIGLPIWNSIADSPAADLTEVPNRPAIWSLLPSTVRSPLMAATTAGWIRRFQAEPGFEKSLEPELAAYVFPPFGEVPLLAYNIVNAAAVGVTAFECFPELGIDRFVSWVRGLDFHKTPLRLDSAVRIGRFVLSRGWKRGAEALADLGSRADAWKPAARECLDLLGVLRRTLLRFRFYSESNRDDFWLAFEELAVELYPRGPTSGKLWSRASGTESDLPTTGTGANIWTAAIHLLKNGGAKKLTVRSLIDAMLHDWAQNGQLGELYALAHNLKL